MDIPVKDLRNAARLTQIELAQRSGIERTRLSLAECGYLSLTDEEASSILRAIAEAAEARILSVRQALAQIRHESSAVAV